MIFIAGLNSLKIITLIYLLISGNGISASAPEIVQDTIIAKDSISIASDSNTNLTKTPKIKVIGHSWGVGAFQNQEKFFSQYGITINEDTKIGTSLQWTLDKLKEVNPDQYDAICIITGINDYRSDIKYITDKFTSILEQALARAPVVFVYNIPYYAPAEGMIKFVNQWLDETEKLNSNIIKVIDVYTEIETQKKNGLKMSGNGLHPTNYKPVRDIFIKEVQKYYNIK